MAGLVAVTGVVPAAARAASATILVPEPLTGGRSSTHRRLPDRGGGRRGRHRGDQPDKRHHRAVRGFGQCGTAGPRVPGGTAR